MFIVGKSIVANLAGLEDLGTQGLAPGHYLFTISVLPKRRHCDVMTGGFL